MASRFRVPTTTIACIVLAGLPAFAQTDVKATLVKHLTISRDFTLKVAEQMPEADYGFKLTPPQMSFAEQMTHLAQDLGAARASAESEARLRESQVHQLEHRFQDALQFLRLRRRQIDTVRVSSNRAVVMVRRLGEEGLSL